MFVFTRVQNVYDRVVKKLIEYNLTISTMESCTGGQIASSITNVDGSSAALKSAYVTYSNEAKVANGVDAGIIEHYGVYSPQTANAMASACMDKAMSDIGVGITGSLNTIDPANADSAYGVVYYCVKMKKGSFEDMRTGDIRFPSSLALTRMRMKLEIAEKVALLVQDLLFTYTEWFLGMPE